MLYRATHTTRYTYAGLVSHCQTEAKLSPRVLPNQDLREWKLSVSPQPAEILLRKDYFGNDVASFAVLDPHDKFTITAESLVDVTPRQPIVATEADLLQATEFLWESPYVPWIESLTSYCAVTQSVESVEALMKHIYRDFSYSPKSTSIETPLADVLRERKGVCQDFAHIMIGALRAHKIPARYVSGYLRGDADFQGAQASHAWVSAFFPHCGWVDFDPTNDILPHTGHLTIAWGRDFGDVTPVKGIMVGGGDHTLEVDVRVRPID